MMDENEEVVKLLGCRHQRPEEVGLLLIQWQLDHVGVLSKQRPWEPILKLLLRGLTNDKNNSKYDNSQ